MMQLNGVQPNPRLSLIRDGMQICQESGVDLVVGLGGGSVMDTAKAIAAGVRYGGDPWDMTRHGQKPYVPPREALPTMMIPTLAATGSEMNPNAVISNPETTEKCPISAPCLYPRVTIADPALTCSVPRSQTAYGAADIIAHVLESYASGVDDTPLNDRIQEGVILTVLEQAPKAVADPQDIGARTHLQWASIVALNGWAQAGTSNLFPMHYIEHVISAHYDIAHGAGLAIVMPAWMRVACEERADRYAQFAARVFGVSSEGGDADRVAREGIDRFVQALKDLGLPTRFGSAGVPADQFEVMAAEILRISAAPDGLLPGRPPLDKAGVLRVLEGAR